ncbi:phage holin family protein [Massilia sp. W12]|uniref:phage holin family protein n=1 Tax=Massilia sp. W12 TaxID=3126507 RepID=UPI0030D0E570
MPRLLLVWLINTAALFAIPWLLPSVHFSNLFAALIAAPVLGLVNLLIRPLLILLTLPVTVVTLGLFLFVVNGLSFWMASGLVPGFTVEGFWPAMGGALLYSIISWALSTLLLEKDDEAA